MIIVYHAKFINIWIIHKLDMECSNTHGTKCVLIKELMDVREGQMDGNDDVNDLPDNVMYQTTRFFLLFLFFSKCVNKDDIFIKVKVYICTFNHLRQALMPSVKHTINAWYIFNTTA